jgi:hypothetical protein
MDGRDAHCVGPPRRVNPSHSSSQLFGPRVDGAVGALCRCAAVIIGLQAGARSPLSLRKKKTRRSTSISNRRLIGHMSVHIADKPFYKIRSARISCLRVAEIPLMDGRSSVDAGKSVEGETGQVHAGWVPGRGGKQRDWRRGWAINQLASYFRKERKSLAVFRSRNRCEYAVASWQLAQPSNNT